MNSKSELSKKHKSSKILENQKINLIESKEEINERTYKILQGKLKKKPKKNCQVRNELFLDESDDNNDPSECESTTSISSSSTKENDSLITKNVEKNLMPKSKIQITKIEDFALVFWIQEKKFSIVSIFAIHSNNGKINEGEEYDISFGKRIYSGLIKCLGSKKKCQDILNTVSQGNEIVPEVKKKREIRATSGSQHHDETLKKLKNLNEENFLLKKKSVELFETVQILRSRNEELEDENKKLEETIQDLKNTFTHEDIRKILSMSEIFQKLFKPNANDKTLVTLSSEYPNFFVEPLARSSVLSLIESCSENQGSRCMRKALLVLVPDTQSWISKTAKQFKRDFANIINPVFDMISKQDSNFNVTALNLTLNSIIQDLKKKN